MSSEIRVGRQVIPQASLAYGLNTLNKSQCAGLQKNIHYCAQHGSSIFGNMHTHNSNRQAKTLDLVSLAQRSISYRNRREMQGTIAPTESTNPKPIS